MDWTARTDQLRAAVGNEGITIAQHAGTVRAWAFLANHGLANGEISRILGGRRRCPIPVSPSNVYVAGSSQR